MYLLLKKFNCYRVAAMVMLFLLLACSFAAVGSEESKCSSFSCPNFGDHLERDVSELNLTSAQLNMVMNAYNSPNIHRNATLSSRAQATHVNVSAHLAFRYLQSSEWVGNFHGKSVNESMMDTVEWRYQYNIPNIDTASIAPLVQQGLAFTSSQLDKHNRAILYVRGGHQGKKESPETYLRLLMYTVERADRMSVEAGSGEFVAVVDLAGFSWSRCPPMSSMTDGISLLKKHYPYRLGGVFIVHAGMAFDILWRIFRPLIPARALRKIFFVSKTDLKNGKILDEHIGLSNLDVDFGGTRTATDLSSEGKVNGYFREGYWARAHSEGMVTSMS